MRLILAGFAGLLLLVAANDTAAEPGDAQSLRQAYAAAVAGYHQCMALPNAWQRSGCGREAADQLAAAGADKLAEGQPHGLSRADWIVMLNDYGFWLSAPGTAANALPVLRKVTSLAPDRAVAWLNLGDAAQAGLGEAATYEEKRRLATEGQQAYDKYRQLTGKKAPHGADLPDFATDDVCSYVADAFTRGSARLIASESGSFDNNGKHVTFGVIYQGSGGYPDITSDDDDETTRLIDPSANDADSDLTSILIVPFRGASYLVNVASGDPDALIKPLGGTVCQFYRYTKPVLVENHSAALCDRLLSNKPFATVTMGSENEDDQGATKFDLVPPANLGGFAEVKFGDATAYIGHYEIDSGAGRGCTSRGLTFLADGRAEQSKRNDALSVAQGEVNDCRTSDTTLVKIGDQLLFKIVGSFGGRGPTPTRRLLRLTGDHLETVCRVDEPPSYWGQHEE